MLKRYKVINRVTNEKKTVLAESAQEACEKLGWLIGDCFIQELFRIK